MITRTSRSKVAGKVQLPILLRQGKNGKPDSHFEPPAHRTGQSSTGSTDRSISDIGPTGGPLIPFWTVGSKWLRYSESPRIEWLIFCVAVLHTVIFQYCFAFFNPDKVIQIAASRSFLDGYGLTVPAVNPAGAMHLVREPVLGWPPGYSLAVLPFFWLTDSPWWATVLTDCCFTGLFFWAWKIGLDKLTGATKGIGSAIWMYWVVAAPILAPRATTSPATSSEFQAVALYSASLTAALWGVDRGVFWTVVSSLLLIAAAATRFAFWPLVLVLPASLLMGGVPGPGRRKHVLTSLLLGVGGLAGLGLLHVHMTGHVTYLSSRTKDAFGALHWPDLLRLYPFPASTLGIDAPAVELLAKLGLGQEWLGLLWLPSFLVLAAYAVGLRHTLRFQRSPGPDRVFAVWGAMTGLLTIFMLAFLTLRYPKTPATWTLDGWWTYVDEARYYTPLLPFLFVGFVAEVLRRLRGKQTSVTRVLFALTVISFMIALAWSGWNWVFLQRKQPSSGWQSSRARYERTALTTLLRGQLAEGKESVYVDPDPVRRSVAQMAGLPTLEQVPRVDNVVPGAHFTLILAVPRAHDSGLVGVCKSCGCELILELQNAAIVRLNLHDICGDFAR